MKGKGNVRFAVIRRYFPIYLCAFILILGVLSGWLLSKDAIPEGVKHFQITADNGVILHVLRTEPSSISLDSINDNVVRSGINNEQQALTICIGQMRQSSWRRVELV